MVFNNNDFIDLLNFYKNKNNFPPNAKQAFEKFTEVSKSDGDNNEFKYSLIIDENYIFDLDNMCWNSNLKKNGSIKSNRPSSVDALHFVKGRLYLIEFKGTYNATIDLDEVISKCIEKLDDTILIGVLERIKNRYDDEILCNLKIKPSDSLFLTLPNIYKYCCENIGKSYNKEEFLAWLLKIPKRLYIVF